MKQILFLIASLIFILMQAVNAQAVEIDKMIQLPQDNWLNLTLMGTKIGYAHIYMEQSEYEGEAAIRIRTDVAMDLKRTGIPFRSENAQVSYVGMDGRPRHFISLANETGQEKRVEGRVKDGVVYLETTLAGETKQSQQPIPPETVSEMMVAARVLEHGIRVGDKYTFNVFNLDLLKPVKTDIEVLREDEISYNGEMKPVYVIDYTMHIMGGLKTTVWVGSDGITYRMKIALMGMPMEFTKTDMETALGEVGEVDVILATKIFAQGRRPVLGSSYFKARLRLAEGGLDKAVVTNQRQKLMISDENQREGILEINVPTVDVLNALDLSTDAQREDMAQFLKSTVYIQADAPKIREKAAELIDGETNSWKAAKKLCRWVNENVSDKNLEVGFGSALQTLESRAGDCTEHTVLLIALARAVGVPARVCAGIVYVGDAFYYHFWPEVYVGEWVSMEPTLGQIQADANHIQLSGSTLESDSMLELGEGAMRTLNQLEIEVIE
jgi:hypothetical protein